MRIVPIPRILDCIGMLILSEYSGSETILIRPKDEELQLRMRELAFTARGHFMVPWHEEPTLLYIRLQGGSHSELF